MPRKRNEAALEGTGPVPRNAYVMLGGITLEDLRLLILMSETLDKAYDEPMENVRSANQRLVVLEKEAQ